MWKTTKRARERLAREQIIAGGKMGGALSVCLVYPNCYRIGMSNLGFQAVFGIFEDFAAVSCDRAFLPDSDQAEGRSYIRSFALGRRLHDFDIVAFSISFETDYLNILKILDLAEIELFAKDRKENAPLVLGGGSAIFLNPEPIADFFDLLLVGESEEMLPEFLESFVAAKAKGAERERVLDELQEVEGAYRPGSYRLDYDKGSGIAVARPRNGHAVRVKRRYVKRLEQHPAYSRILPAESVFDNMFLIEASRGCQWGCRFCAAGYMYRPVRHLSYESLAALVRKGLERVPNIGLVGAELGSLRGLSQLCELASSEGGRVSPSSLRADTVTDQLALSLEQGATRTVTIAPEAGSERLRQVINKNLPEEAILGAASRLGRRGVKILRLYFMIGLPTEQEDDVSAVVTLTGKIRERFHAQASGARIRVSVSPFVPKPWTPFQWEALEEVSSLKRKIAFLRRRVHALGGVTLEAGSPREAYYQTLLSRGDRRISTLLYQIHRCGEGWWSVIQKLRRAGGDGEIPSPDRIVHQTYSRLDRLPWDIIDQGISKNFLWREREKALASTETQACDILSCRVCGIC